MADVVFYVQHLLGIGHFMRSFRVAAATARVGLDVALVSGGPEVPDPEPARITRYQLPSLRAGPGGFRDLRRGDGAAATTADLVERRRRLCALLAELKPRLLVVEAFPFGRWQLRDEIVAMLEAAHALEPRPLVVSSIRDILQESRKPGRTERTLTAFDRYFDAVLVHGDPHLVRLDESFPAAAHLAARLHYTGIVAPPRSPPPATGTPRSREIVVSAGGGAVGEKLLAAACAAHDRLAAKGYAWRLIGGLHPSPTVRGLLAAHSGDTLAIEDFRRDLAGLLACSALSISQAGYNTVADILVADVPAVLVPYATGGETEQSMRAERLAALGLALCLPEDTLDGAALAVATEAALALPRPAVAIDLDGAAHSARLMTSWLRSGRIASPA
ncbi:MAG: glycosyl transferase [Hyphomicrobiaceae bacterium]|nr:glycosyl transferase [Hyphomicrobiaceae bacterium]